MNDVTSGVSAVTMFVCRKYLLNDKKTFVGIYTISNAYVQSKLNYIFALDSVVV